MPTRRELWLLLPRPVRQLPADLAAVVVLTVVTLATVFVPVVNETPLRVVFGLAFVLFLPGYAFIAALFPEEGESPTGPRPDHGEGDGEPDTENADEAPAPVPGTRAAAEAEREDGTDDGLGFSRTERSGIDGIERVALSFGLSIAIVPLIGLALNFTPWGIRLTPIAVSVTFFTLGCVAVAAVRRWELSEDERFRVPYREWLARAREEVFEPDDRIDAVLNVALALSILLALGSVGYAIAVPPQGEQFTEFYVLTEDDDGELVADGYPEVMALDETAELVVGIENHEHETMEYTVVMQLQTVEIEGNESTVLDYDEVDRYTRTLAHNESSHDVREFSPTKTGEDLRLQFLLYADDVPDEPTRENAYRDLHLWITADESSS